MSRGHPLNIIKWSHKPPWSCVMMPMLGVRRVTAVVVVSQALPISVNLFKVHAVPQGPVMMGPWVMLFRSRGMQSGKARRPTGELGSSHVAGITHSLERPYVSAVSVNLFKVHAVPMPTLDSL